MKLNAKELKEKSKALRKEYGELFNEINNELDKCESIENNFKEHLDVAVKQELREHGIYARGGRTSAAETIGVSNERDFGAISTEFKQWGDSDVSITIGACNGNLIVQQWVIGPDDINRLARFFAQAASYAEYQFYMPFKEKE